MTLEGRMDTVLSPLPRAGKTPLDRALSLFTDVRAGEGLTALLMLVNIFLLLVCYSVIKTVREPLILLGGGAEVRSYTAAGQALVLMAFVPLYSWFASRVDRLKLLVGVSCFFVLNIELFALAVATHVPYVGVAFFIWVGIFNISLTAQFWSYANEIYTKEAGDRLFPLIMIGMTGGAPLGSLVAGQLFGRGFTPQAILQISASLLLVTLLLYVLVNQRQARSARARPAPLARGGGFALVFQSGYLRLVATLIVLLNVVNTTGEYMVARLLTAHADDLALANPVFDKQAYFGAFAGSYQFWVNVTALALQAFVASRLVKYKGLRGALLALPLIALGGYAVIAAGVGFAIVRWIKTAENATDYSIMNTARQLLWLPTTPEEKYKAKQAIDTFFVRGGDLVSAAVVYAGTHMLQLSVAGFGTANVLLTVAWIAVAILIVARHRKLVPLARAATVALAVAITLLTRPTSALAQDRAPTREAAIEQAQAEKAKDLKPYVPGKMEALLNKAEHILVNGVPRWHPYFESAYYGGGFTLGAGYAHHVSPYNVIDVRGSYTVLGYKRFEAAFTAPRLFHRRGALSIVGGWREATQAAFYGIGMNTSLNDRTNFDFQQPYGSGMLTLWPTRSLLMLRGGLELSRWSQRSGHGRFPAVDRIYTPATLPGLGTRTTYVHSQGTVGFDWRTSPGYSRRGGFYGVTLHDYTDPDEKFGFRQVHYEVIQHFPILREAWVISLRGEAQTSYAKSNQQIPFFLLPYAGSGSTMRGFTSHRFRDQNRIVAQAEWRIMVNRFMDTALFYDAGKVTARRADLDFTGLKSDYGFGVRFHGPFATPLRIDVARSAEGTRLVFATQPIF
jgi:AAA family ATP:ADP antiporter